MGDFRTSEIVSLSYFLFLALLAWARPVPWRARGIVTAVALCVAAAVRLTMRVPSPVAESLRDWLPVVLLVLGYWTPGALVSGTNVQFERWLRAVDARLFDAGVGRGLLKAPGPLKALLEASYATVYPLVPLSFGLVVTADLYSEVDRFWTTVLSAEFVCYGLLPWLPTRPPRTVEQHANRSRSAASRLNRWVLDRFSNQWNTFPSGHVAGSLACALAVTPVLPTAGAILMALAILIAVASVAGRYHYAADALAGWGVAVGCFAVVRLCGV